MANEIFDQNDESNFKTLEINTEKKNTKSILFDDFIRFLILSLGFLIYFYYVYKYAYNHYEKRKIKNLEGVDVELKTDLS